MSDELSLINISTENSSEEIDNKERCLKHDLSFLDINTLNNSE